MSSKSKSNKGVKGRRARQYGHEFENLIKNKVKKRFADRPWADAVRRSDQSHRAHLPDVANWPALWPELEVGASVNPLNKLAQAIRDSTVHGKGLTAVAITRKKGSPSVRATLTIHDLIRLLDRAGKKGALNDLVICVELDFDDFCDLYDAAELDKVKHRMPEAEEA